MSSVDPGKNPTHWRSLDHRDGAPEPVEAFRPDLLPDDMPEADRRRFLKLMGASLALAGVAGCTPHPNNPSWPRWPKANILPHASRPAGTQPGKPEHYATQMERNGVARPVLAKSYDGRPIKLEGNPEHPASRGAADLLSQASVLDLYNPHRSKGVARMAGGEKESSWEEFLGGMGPALQAQKASGGRGLRILSEASSSVSLASVRARLQREFPQAGWHEWESVGRETEREGTRALFGRPLRPRYALDQAHVIVSLDEDFLGTHPDAVRNARDFAVQRRADHGSMSRFYAVEGTFSLTGSNADVRVPAATGAVGQVAWALAAQLVQQEHVSLPAGLSGMSSLLREAAAHGEHWPQVARMAKDLAGAGSHALVCAGPAQPADVHALAHALNLALGAVGTTVTYAEDPAGTRPTHAESLRRLTADLNGGHVDVLIVLGGNPVYDAPADVDFAAAAAKAGHSAHLSLYRDETSQACGWHLPRAHALEAWSDARSWDGTVSVGQPLIAPLYGGLTPAETLGALLDGAPPRGDELVRQALGLGAGKPWRRAVHDGFLGGTTGAAVSVSPAGNWSPSKDSFQWHDAGSGRVAVTFRPDAKMWDGRFAGNAWLQELPDPMTKLTWDNAALIAPATARELGLGHGDVVRLSHDGRALEIPVFLMPGQVAGEVTLPLGYGRYFVGRMAERDKGDRPVGVNASQIRPSASLGFLAAADLSATGARHKLVTTQDHHVIPGVDNAKQMQGQAERIGQIYREASLEEYKAHPDFATHRTHHPPLKSLWEEHSYDTGYRWGMAIDLTACNGCSACVVACQAENNIPVTGKDEVARGREMHWIRVDRYFTGDVDNPQIGHQPMTCHHCENAPCEQVCPVAATTHSDEGLNDMVYNRCVGTRYCLNNCPYKVRRFNWFNNFRHVAETVKMQHNPDVTVRARGVMEKCTYCVQRIKAATIPAGNEGRSVRDGEITPACAQTCPTDAIVFGDLNDPESRVRKAQDNSRAYALLSELNVKPRTNYLAKLRNPGGDAHGNGSHGEHGSHDGHGHAAADSPRSTPHRG